MSTDRTVDQFTLREMFTESERLSRELSDHLERALLPRVSALSEVVSPRRPVGEELPVEDGLVRTQAANLLESDQFAERLCDRLIQFGQAIDQNVERIVQEG